MQANGAILIQGTSAQQEQLIEPKTTTQKDMKIVVIFYVVRTNNYVKQKLLREMLPMSLIRMSYFLQIIIRYQIQVLKTYLINQLKGFSFTVAPLQHLTQMYLFISPEPDFPNSTGTFKLTGIYNFDYNAIITVRVCKTNFKTTSVSDFLNNSSG